MYNYFSKDIHVWNFYGPAEATIASTYRHVDITIDIENIPIGRPLPNYICQIYDQWLQPVFINQEGELFVGGVGVFAGYFRRDDLTERVLFKINDELYYRTGDLVRMDNNGLLQYHGRKDHQIKLHGQRIELGEIERCLLNLPISACIVTKWGDNHLVAYVQSFNIDEKQLREHCQSHLPSHMIPSIFIVLKQLPLNANGKVDRKQLPPPSIALPSLPNSEDQHFELNDVIKTQIQSLWCKILQRTHISIDANFFSVGGHSLLLIQLYHHYKMTFNLNTNTINMAQLIAYPTIADHVRFIHQSRNCAQPDAASWFLLRFDPGKSCQCLI